jgi:hypothetical protein
MIFRLVLDRWRFENLKFKILNSCITSQPVTLSMLANGLAFAKHRGLKIAVMFATL